MVGELRGLFDMFIGFFRVIAGFITQSSTYLSNTLNIDATTSLLIVSAILVYIWGRFIVVRRQLPLAFIVKTLLLFIGVMFVS